MGKPKALVSFCGAPLICRSLRRLGAIADQLVVTSNQRESLDFLCTDATGDRLEIYADLLDVRGALNGMYTALHYAKHPSVAIVACDMVFPSAALLKAEQQLLLDTGADVVIPTTSHGYEPFHAVYRRETCLPLVQEALDAGKTKATCWFDKARVTELSHEEVLAIDPRGGSFTNVNTPDDLEHIEQRVLSGEMTKIYEDGNTDANASQKIHACGYQAP